MEAVLIILGSIVLLAGACAWLFFPRLLALMVWPILFMYPQALFFGMLPLNAGVDDMLILLVGVRILFYHDPEAPPGVGWAKPIVALAFGMAAMQSISELFGVFRYSELYPFLIRNALKGIVFVSFAVIVAKTTVTERAVRSHLASFMLALSGGFLLLLLCSVYPPASQIFEAATAKTRHELAYLAGTAEMRNWGPFDSSAGVGVIIAAVVPLAVGLMANRGSGILRFLAAAMLVTAFVAQFVSKTRSALMGLIVIALGWMLLSRWRWRLMFIMLVAATIAILLAWGTEYGNALARRVTPERVMEDLTVRADIWAIVIKNPSPMVVAFGEGAFATEMRLQVAPHNGYLDAFFLWGLGGVTMFALLYGTGAMWSRRVARYDDLPLGRVLGWSSLWSMIGIAGVAMFLDPWYVSNYRYFLYFLLAAVWNRHAVIRQRQALGEYADEMDPTQVGSQPRNILQSPEVG